MENNITIRQVEFKSTTGVDTLFGWLYIPSGEPRGIVQVAHGMSEHMGRYHEFMRFLAQNGFVAAGMDQLGHGRSQNGHYGFFAERDGWRAMIDDQYKFHKIIHSEVANVERTVLFGHSMGSFVARMYAAKYPRTISGLILSGTARGGLRTEVGLHTARFAMQKHGAHFVAHDLDRMAFGLFNERIRPVKTPFDWLSRDEEWVRRYVEDTDCGFVFTAGAFADLFMLMLGANRRRTFDATRKDLPVLIVSGTMDPVGEYGKGPEQVYTQYRKAGVADTALVLYEGARHELLGELNREEVYTELLGWLDDHFRPEALDAPVDPLLG